MRLIGICLIAISALSAADPAGEWHGSLKPVATVELRLKFDIRRNANTALSADMYSIDQGSTAIAASNVTVQGDKLNLEFSAIKASFEGQFSTDGKSISGTWSQNGNSLPLKLEKGRLPADTTSATAASLAGAWEGALDVGQQKLRLRLNIVQDTKGNVSSTVDSLDQGAMGLVVSGLNLQGAVFHFDVKAIGGSYDGKLDAKKTSLNGMWKQSGGELPLEFKKVN